METTVDCLEGKCRGFQAENPANKEAKSISKNNKTIASKQMTKKSTKYKITNDGTRKRGT